MIIKKACSFCHKVSDILSEIDLGSSGKMLIFACGHSYIETSLTANISETKSLFEQLESAVPEYCETHDRQCIKTLSSASGKHPFPYQARGTVAAFKNNAKFIFADEMGLGKTVQGLMTLLLDKENLLPAIFLCKSIAKQNWLRETVDWLGIPAQVIYSSSDTPFDIFKVHILSHDMVNRVEKKYEFSKIEDQWVCEKCGRESWNEESFCSAQTTEKAVYILKDENDATKGFKAEAEGTKSVSCLGKMIKKLFHPSGVWARQPAGAKEENTLAWLNIISRAKTIILDESHLLKNPESQRSKAVVKLSSRIPHKMCMSGTLIKNNATEYFIPLNIIKPERYWRYSSFCMNNVRYENVKTAIGYGMKYTGLINPERFKEETKEFMIRRTTDEVLPELPKLFKKMHYVELDEKFKEVYQESEKQFAEWFDTATKQELSTNLLAQLAILRHETSLAKIDATIDLVTEFILSCDRKLAIFTHHLDSRNILAERMDKYFLDMNKELGTDIWAPVTVLGRGADVQEEIEAFKNGKSRIIILSTLSHGESINLQFCSDSILHERQWNPANEDQAISGRFRRIGQEAKSISCMIPVALGTIDEYYVQIVDGIKSAIGREYDTGKIENYNSNFVFDLAENIAKRGRKGWKL